MAKKTREKKSSHFSLSHSFRFSPSSFTSKALAFLVDQESREISLSFSTMQGSPALLLQQQRAGSGLSASFSGGNVAVAVFAVTASSRPRKTPSIDAAFRSPARALWRSTRSISSTLARSSTPGSGGRSSSGKSKGFGGQAEKPRQNAARPISIESKKDDADDDAAAAAAAVADSNVFVVDRLWSLAARALRGCCG